MNIGLFVDGELGGVGHVDDAGMFVLDSEHNGWNWLRERLRYDEMREIVDVNEDVQIRSLA